MSTFKCKMCGGDLEITPESTIAECKYCDSKQTVPTADSEKKMTLFSRANRLRFACEFDKAYSIYESIVADFPEEAEGYWGLVLCDYGIEYVDDPATGDKVPTCHRSSFDSIFEDENFNMVMENADMLSKTVYRDEAKQIEELRKGIIDVSSKEKPYDIFICYKETDANGERTSDSVMAQDVYDALTEKGYRVFFSRITLEDKLGVEYEPYIFAALNSAKVMLAFGTSCDYYNAVWVKNEWSRFLKLIAKDKSKHLIPCFKCIDAYDMPPEFKNLQAQDMGKVGATQDLLRGVAKILGEKKEVIKETVVVNSNSANTEALLKRVFMFLGDGEWASADEYCEKVLDQDPENARAYLGKLMAELRIRKEEELGLQTNPFTYRNNYKKALRFADESLKITLNDYDESVNAFIYKQANGEMANATSIDEYKQAAKKFNTILIYKDSKSLMNECYDKAQQMRLQKENEQRAAEKKRLAEKAEKDAAKAAAKAEKDAAEAAEKAAAEAAEKKRYRIKRLVIACVILSLIGGYLLKDLVIDPKVKYDNAVEMLESGKVSEARNAFLSLGNYKDSFEQAKECLIIFMDGKYDDAVKLLEKGDIINAYHAFIGLNGYKDSATQASNMYEDYKDELIKTAEIGSIIKLGTYEQDNNLANDTEEIEWLVLDKKDGKLLVISYRVLDAKEYDSSNEISTWETCTLRKWLNNDFINSAFTNEEKAKIPTVTVEAHKNPKWDTDQGNNTQDKIFLLSVKEASGYFSSAETRIGHLTAYAEAQGARYWWLRTRGFTIREADYVGNGGGIGGSDFESKNYGVRPAMWIEIEE